MEKGGNRVLYGIKEESVGSSEWNIVYVKVTAIVLCSGAVHLELGKNFLF